MPYLENTENFISQITLIGYGFGSIVECLSNTHAALGSTLNTRKRRGRNKASAFSKNLFQKKKLNSVLSTKEVLKLKKPTSTTNLTSSPLAVSMLAGEQGRTYIIGRCLPERSSIKDGSLKIYNLIQLSK